MQAVGQPAIRRTSIAMAIVTPASISMLAILVRVPFFWWPLISDEGGYAYTAYWWLRGLTLYGNQIWYDKPQGIFAIYALGLSVFGWDTWSIRLLGALAAAAATLVIYFAGRTIHGRREAPLAALLFVVCSSAPFVEGFTSNAEIFMVVPLTLAALCTYSRRWLTAGLLVSVAIVIKPSALSGVALAAAWLLFTREGPRAWGRFFLGCALPVGLAMTQAAATVGLYRYVYSIVLYRAGALDGGVTWVTVVGNWLVTSPAWLLLLVFAMPAIRRTARTVLWFEALWLLFSLGGMALGGAFYWHYFIQLMPPLSLLAASGLIQVRAPGIVPPRLLHTALPLCALLIFQFPFLMLGPKVGSWFLYHRAGYQVADAAAEYIRERSTESDLVYAAFSEADIYHLARRRSALPYNFRFPLVVFPGAYDELVAVIESRKPLYVLALDQPMTNVDPEGRFWRALDAGYEVETTCEGIPLYRRRKAE